MELLGIIFNLSLCMVMVVAMSAPGPAQIGVDGGYADIVIKINKDACREDCPARVRRLKVIIFVLSPLPYHHPHVLPGVADDLLGGVEQAADRPRIFPEFHHRGAKFVERSFL